MRQRVLAAITQLSFSLSHSYLDWDPRTQDGATHIQNRSSPSVDSLWKDSSRHPKLSNSNLPDKFKHGDIFTFFDSQQSKLLYQIFLKNFESEINKLPRVKDGSW